MRTMGRLPPAELLVTGRSGRRIRTPACTPSPPSFHHKKWSALLCHAVAGGGTSVGGSQELRMRP